MTLGPRHMTVALALLAGSIVYNVWVYTKPRGRGVVEPVLAVSLRVDPSGSGSLAGDQASAAAAGPAREAPDVDLSREPLWARNPFASAAAPHDIEEPVVAPPPAAAETVPVVNAVLYSSGRKLAMVNGRTVRVGDHVGGWTVAGILPDAVVLAAPSGATRTVTRRMPAFQRSDRD